MKIFQIFFIFLLLIKIHAQTSKNDTNNINQKEVKKEEKPFNLTESLINFFYETFGGGNNKTKNETNSNINKDNINNNNAKTEKINTEGNKKKEKSTKFDKEHDKFVQTLANNSFEDVVQINLKKGEKEILYLDLQSHTKIKLAVMLSDNVPEEKINFFFTGPNRRGMNTVIQQYYNKNYLFWEYDIPITGEYYAEITNKGTKENEIYFLLNDGKEKKNDLLEVEKLDKISMLLNNIDNNINQLRNKKKIEIKQVNSHNQKVTENNKWIVIYSLIEICTMITVFMIQNCYINSIVNKL